MQIFRESDIWSIFSTILLRKTLCGVEQAFWTRTIRFLLYETGTHQILDDVKNRVCDLYPLFIA